MRVFSRCFASVISSESAAYSFSPITSVESGFDFLLFRVSNIFHSPLLLANRPDPYHAQRAYKGGKHQGTAQNLHNGMDALKLGIVENKTAEDHHQRTENDQNPPTPPPGAPGKGQGVKDAVNSK